MVKVNIAKALKKLYLYIFHQFFSFIYLDDRIGFISSETRLVMYHKEIK